MAPAEKKVTNNGKNKKTTTTQVADFLKQTGFIFEMAVGDYLRNQGYEVHVNERFYDYDGEKKREIDIIAKKKVNDISILLIIECKQSLKDDWIFICTDKRPARYYMYQKHFPRINDYTENKVFDHLPVYDRKIPLAQNYIIRGADNKKSKSIQIDSCLEKLPKALIDVLRSSTNDSTRTLALSLAVFSGQMFIARHDACFEVKEADSVQYCVDLETEAYKYRIPPKYLLARSALGGGGEGDKTQKENSPVAAMNRDQGVSYLIDFLTMKGLKSYLRNLENKVGEIKTELWPIKQSNVDIPF